MARFGSMKVKELVEELKQFSDSTEVDCKVLIPNRPYKCETCGQEVVPPPDLEWRQLTMNRHPGGKNPTLTEWYKEEDERIEFERLQKKFAYDAV